MNVMKFDLLFRDDSTPVSECLLDDMLVRKIQKYVFGESQNLADSFRKVIALPLTNINAIEKRQTILRELLSRRGWLEDILSVLERAKSIQRENRKNLYQQIDADQRLRINLVAVIAQFSAIEDLNNLFNGQLFLCEDLRKIQIYFLKQDSFQKMKKDLVEIADFLKSKQYFAGNISFNDQMKFKSMSLVSIKKEHNLQRVWKRYVGVSNYKRQEKQIVFSDNKTIERCLTQIGEKTTYHFCKVLSGIYSFFRTIFSELYDQLEFYMAAITYIVYLEQHGFWYCFPEFVKTEKTIRTSGMYPLPLAIETNQIISENDFGTKDDSIFIITGYNRGGKTTFLRSIGLNQILAQAGVVVPSKHYVCSVFNNIVAHFPKNEDVELKYGMFEREVAVLQRDLATISTNALVLMNESFSSTTEDEGCTVVKEVLMALAETNSTVFFVTHFYKLANDIADFNAALKSKATAVNLVTAIYEKPSQRVNYKIIRGEPLPTYNINLSDFV